MIDTEIGLSDADIKRYRAIERLTRRWEAYYLARGVGRWKAAGLARGKAHNGRQVPA